jgi:hypothetical protein
MTFRPIYLSLALASAVPSPVLHAQDRLSAIQLGQMAPQRQMAPEYEEKANELRNAPAQTYDFSKSNLGDVLRYLATDAKINFISLDEESKEANQVITFNITGSPFTVLETLCNANGLALIPENGMWYIRPADDRELIGKAYQIRYNPLELVEKSQNNTQQSGSGIMGASIHLQGAQETFKVKPSELVRKIRQILDLPPEEGDGAGAAAGIQAMAAQATGQGGPGAEGSGSPESERKPKVLWESDSNTLYVVATRMQHMWVEGYLNIADREQAQIAIEVKFVETSHDPQKELGLDWGGTLGQEGTFWQTTKAEFDPAGGESVPYQKINPDGSLSWDYRPTGQYNVSQQMVPNTSGGFRTDLANLFNVRDLNGIEQKPWQHPFASVFSYQDISVKLRALLSDSDTKTTSYPRMVVSNNREAVFKSVVNQPVLSGSSSVGGGGGAAATAEQIEYLPIGTVLNILPKQMDTQKVSLNIGITVSNIIGETIISGNPYPVATSRVYNAPVVVDSGYTVAISGLDEAREKESQSGVPLLSRIPIIKYAFSSKSRSKNHKNLLIFITPAIIDTRMGGLPDEPVSVVPRKPDALMPKKPQIDPDGQLAGGPDAVKNAVDYLERECEVIERTIREARSRKEESQKLTDMKKALNTLEQQIEQMGVQYPDKAAMLSTELTRVSALQSKVSSLKMLVLKKAYY